MPTASDFIDNERTFGASNYAPLPVVLHSGQGAWLWDVDGKKYLDMMGAYSAVSHGHLHPRIVGALKRQLDDVAVVSRAYYSDQLAPMLQTLCRLSGMDAALPMNSGAEAVETAIKAVRRYATDVRGIPEGKAEIIVAEGNFHGRTTTIVGFSSEPAYKRGFGPFAPGFVEVPFGDADAVARAITPNTAAILVEPIQGEAGIRVPPAGYLKQLREICNKTGVLLVFDEIQSGLGRTGRMFCFEHEGARPDGLCVGKALGGGLLAVSAFVARRDIMDVFGPGSHGSTFGGNPLAAAVAHEALLVLEQERLVDNSAAMGRLLMDYLGNVKHKAIREVRGRGLWVGVELDPAIADAHDVVLGMMRRGVLSKETHATTLRFAPPLIVGPDEIAMGVTAFVEALEEVSK